MIRRKTAIISDRAVSFFHVFLRASVSTAINSECIVKLIHNANVQ